MKEWGAQLIYGDLSIPESIPPCFYGVTAVIDASTSRVFDYYSTSTVDLFGKQYLIKSAMSAKVDRFIFFSLINLENYSSKDIPLVRYKKEVENLIQTSGLKYTIFRLPGFYQGLINQYCVPILDQQPVWLTGESTSIAYMDTQDIAKFVIKALSVPKAENQYVNLSNQYAWTSEEIIKLCEALSGKRAQVNRIPMTLLKLLRNVTKCFEWTYNISDRLAFSEVLVNGKTIQASMQQTYDWFGFKSEDILPLEKYLQEYFSRILKKLKELNYDQKQKKNDVVF